MMIVAIVDQVNKGHIQGWKGHSMEGICMPLPTPMETTMLALNHTLWMVTGDKKKKKVCLGVHLSLQQQFNPS